MYIPSAFRNVDLNEVKEFIKSNGFGILLSNSNQKILGSHIPLDLIEDENGNEVLSGHIAKANHQVEDISGTSSEVLVIFNGPHSYISSSWYDHDNVPTWNYIAVHIYGTIKIIEGEQLYKALNKLVDKYEKNMASPDSMDKMSPETLKQINGIIGFNISIKEIQAAYKLSQNRKDYDYHNVVKELENNGDENSLKVAKIMQEKRPKS